MKSYLELMTIPDFKGRLEYLRCKGSIGVDTFGHDRYLNQVLYKSKDWKRIRDSVILRDNGCDMALADYPVTKAYIHHINPITVQDIVNRDPAVFDMNNLVTVSFKTHNNIHYGAEVREDPNTIIERKPNDTCPWRK